MSSQVITFEGSDDTIRVLDEIAENLGADRASVLREAVSLLISHYSELNADIGEARRQIDSGQFTRHEDVVREFRSQDGRFAGGVIVRWSDEAVADLRGIRDYISPDSESSALRQCKLILDAVDQLRDFKLSGPESMARSTRRL